MTEQHGHGADHGQQHGAHQHGHHHQPGEFSSAEAIEMLDLEGVVLREYWDAAMSWIHDAAAGAPRSRLLDVGTGTGSGALGLARRFPDAEVIGVDVAPDSLRRLEEKARDLGLAPRVRAVEADLDAGWPDLGTLDLTLASMSLHHMADPSRVLRDIRTATRPEGLIAVAEFSDPLRFLPEDLGFGKPGFEDRLVEAVHPAHTEAMPTLGTAWAPRLAEAGWTVVDEHEFRIDQNPPSHPDANQYAIAWFTRLAQAHADSDPLDPDDRATLTALLAGDGPQSLRHRTDLHIRGTRTITLAKRAE